jgi:hypothetical protein
MSSYGSFNEHAMAVWDFARCQKPDGTIYGTKGKCRKGKEIGGKEGEKPAESPPTQTEKGGVLKGGTGDLISGGDKEFNKQKLTAQPAPAKAKMTPTDETSLRRQRKEEARQRSATYREGQLNANLSDAQRKAIANYTREPDDNFEGVTYKEINTCLRNPEYCPSWAKREVDSNIRELDSALAQLPGNEKGEKFWRAMRGTGRGSSEFYKFLENAKPGQKITDPGFGSYTFDEDTPESFATGRKSILLVSRNKNLRPITEHSNFSSEYEAMLPRGIEQTIKSVTKVGDSLIVELE